ncbi:hypothetical protein DFH09DRAFT_1105973 [Mycena vulgaris]|nr:hypothetical protein DFH09DRAFT_1105973 [Mycena vulgaris]
MALDSLWMTVASLLAAFDITKAVGEDGKEIEPSGEYLSGLACIPLPFQSPIKPGSKRPADLVEATSMSLSHLCLLFLCPCWASKNGPNSISIQNQPVPHIQFIGVFIVTVAVRRIWENCIVKSQPGSGKRLGETRAHQNLKPDPSISSGVQTDNSLSRLQKTAQKTVKQPLPRTSGPDPESNGCAACMSPRYRVCLYEKMSPRVKHWRSAKWGRWRGLKGFEDAGRGNRLRCVCGARLCDEPGNLDHAERAGETKIDIASLRPGPKSIRPPPGLGRDEDRLCTTRMRLQSIVKLADEAPDAYVTDTPPFDRNVL